VAGGGCDVAPKPSADPRYDPDPQLKELLESEFFKSGAWKSLAKPEAKPAKAKKAPAKRRAQRQRKCDSDSDDAPEIHRPDFYSSVMIV
jgi:hypothetical protein